MATIERLFGKQLIKCDLLIDNLNDKNNLINTIDALINYKYLGVYFSFANINQKNDELLKKLKDFYEHVNNNCGVGSGDVGSSGGVDGVDGATKKLEIVQVVLWAHNDVYSDFEKGYHDNLMGLPWYAVPFNEIDLKMKLSKKYRIKSGVPTLVLLDTEGATISMSAQDKLLEDPLGIAFPWRPRPVDQVLQDIILQKGGVFSENHQDCCHQELKYCNLPLGDIRGFYFSANWCPPCRAFTPQLIEAYQLIRKNVAANFEIIFVSSDRSEDSYNLYIEGMPWLCIPFKYNSIRGELAQLYGIRGIPTLLLLDGNSRIITMDGRTDIMEDPKVVNFPWRPRPVNILTERYATKLYDYPAIILFIDGDDSDIKVAENLLLPIATNYYKTNNITNDSDNDNCLQFLIGIDNETSDIIKDLINLDDDLTPILIGLDLPNRHFSIMPLNSDNNNDNDNNDNGNNDDNNVSLLSQYNCDNIQQFIQQFQNGNVQFINILK